MKKLLLVSLFLSTIMSIYPRSAHVFIQNNPLYKKQIEKTFKELLKFRCAQGAKLVGSCVGSVVLAYTTIKVPFVVLKTACAVVDNRFSSRK